MGKLGLPLLTSINSSVFHFKLCKTSAQLYKSGETLESLRFYWCQFFFFRLQPEWEKSNFEAWFIILYYIKNSLAKQILEQLRLLLTKRWRLLYFLPIFTYVLILSHFFTTNMNRKGCPIKMICHMIHGNHVEG